MAITILMVLALRPTVLKIQKISILNKVFIPLVNLFFLGCEATQPAKGRHDINQNDT
jgi:hypothetical protein